MNSEEVFLHRFTVMKNVENLQPKIDHCNWAQNNNELVY